MWRSYGCIITNVVGTLSLSPHGIPYSELSLADAGAFPQEVAECGYQAGQPKPLSVRQEGNNNTSATSSASAQASVVWIFGKHSMAPSFPGCHHQVWYRSFILMPRSRIPLLIRAWKRARCRRDGVLCYWLFLKCGISVYPTVTECLFLLFTHALQSVLLTNFLSVTWWHTGSNEFIIRMPLDMIGTS